MSDTSSDVLDPQRPWLTNAEELPSQMNWAQTLFNPTGKTPRLHFTRAWTLLFMLQLLIIVIPFAISTVVNLAGGDGKSIGQLGVYATPVVFIVTTLMSYVIHARRLNDARKFQPLAILPLIPLVLGGFAFLATVQSETAKYDKQFETRQEYLADPDAFRAKQREEAQKAREEAEKKAAEAEANGEEPAGQQQRGPRRGPGGQGGASVNLDAPMPPKAETVLKAALPMIQLVMIPFSGLIALWSLLWVARVPFFGTYPGSDQIREHRGYEV